MPSLVDGVLSLSELSAQLQVSTQTIDDFRSQGRGPRDSRVGRELRFRVSEIEAWLTRGERVIAETRIRDADGRVRHVRVSARSASRARQVI